MGPLKTSEMPMSKSNEVLIVCEKPTACKKIAKILDENNKPKSLKKDKVTFYKAFRNGLELNIVSAIGHLYTVVKKDKSKTWDYPFWDVKWVPSHEVNKADKSKVEFIEFIKELGEKSDYCINACDYDLEGATIGYNVIKYCFGQNHVDKAARMKFSNLTEQEIINSYDNLLNSLNFNLIDAGLTRHEVDYLYGINLSTALTASTRTSDVVKFKLLSTGRVQGPTLKFILEKEKKIRNFVPTPYWKILGTIDIKGKEFEIEYEKARIDNLQEAKDVLKACRKKDGIVENIESRTMTRQPPIPFNLSSLQSEAYNHFGYTPSRTLNIAEKLYLSAHISYPRTGNQIIPDEMDVKAIITQLATLKDYKEPAEYLLKTGKIIPTKGKKTDPAHPPILPTTETPTSELKTVGEQKLYDLIVTRFLALFADPASIESYKIILGVNGNKFFLRSKKIIVPGWMDIYHYSRTKEVELPDIKIGQAFSLNLKREDKFNQGPSKFNQNSLRKKMEVNEIGTKATRASIIDKLYKRGYIIGKSIDLMDLGLSVTEVLDKNCPEITSVEMTRNLERRMDEIEEAKITREDVLLDVRGHLDPILQRMKEREEEIGNELGESVKRTWNKQRIIGKCISCDDGQLVVIRSLKTKKRFIGCTNYNICNTCLKTREECTCKCEACGQSKGTCECKEKVFVPKCDTSFPIAQKGTLTPIPGKTCAFCESEFGINYPMVQIWLPGARRPFNSCMNWVNHPKKPKKAKKVKETEINLEEEIKSGEEEIKKMKDQKKSKKIKKNKKTVKKIG
ncbi:MAG: DNA topoisomerase I [Candidatus Lokiarchaeota archaeon]|nr:DNA topoisomerase I [Candidatus Lokiarchaeota archaeon]